MANLRGLAPIAGRTAERSQPGSGAGVELGPFVEREPAMETEARAAADDGELGESAWAQAHAVSRRQVSAGFAAAHARRPLAGSDVDDSVGHGALIRLNVGNSSTA